MVMMFCVSSGTAEISLGDEQQVQQESLKSECMLTL